jgi:cobalt-zinc-cadmium efflux system outer membrane protein
MPSYAQTLTEKQFLDDALLNHPATAAAEASVSAAAGSRKQAGIVDNPEISWEREDPEVVPRQDTLRLDWRLPFDGRKHRVAAGEAQIAASKSDLTATRLAIRLEMRALYASWYVAAQREAILQDQVDRTRRLAAWLKARADEGEVAGVEAHRLELEVEVLEREAVAARAVARAERAAAAAWSDLVTDTVHPSRPLLVPPPSGADTGDRPDIAALAHRVEVAEAQHRLNKRVLDPPEISLGWTEIREGRFSFDGPVFGVAWPVPLFDRNQGNRAAAKAEVSRANWQLEGAQRRAVAEADGALAAYTDLYGMAVSADSVPADAQVAAAVFAAFEAGEASLTDVLDTLRSTVEVQQARLESLAQALAAERELEAAIGRPIPPGESS